MSIMEYTVYGRLSMNRALKAFTLAELLIALAILGVIATFTIPKVLQAMQDNQRKAVFKEVIASLSGINYEGWTTKQLTPSTAQNFILSRVNAVKICNTNAQTEGCW